MLMLDCKNKRYRLTVDTLTNDPSQEENTQQDEASYAHLDRIVPQKMY